MLQTYDPMKIQQDFEFLHPDMTQEGYLPEKVRENKSREGENQE
jgi:hypothetical protein